VLAARGASAAGPIAELPAASAVEVHHAEGADDCPGADAFAASVERQLGRRALVPGPDPSAPTAFEIWLWREGATRRARLVARGGHAGERELVDRGEGCEGLAEALAATMAIALSEGAPPPEARPAGPDAPAQGLGVALEAGVDATANLLGSFLPAGRALVEIRPRPWLGFGLGALATPTARFDRGPGSTAISLLAAELRVCAGWAHLRPLGVAFCASTLGGALRARGRGYSPDREASGGWVALSAGPRLEGDLYGPLGWTAHASALVPLWADRFTVDSLGAVYQAPAIGVLAGGGLRLTIR
jgi:hypothetical protein